MHVFSETSILSKHSTYYIQILKIIKIYENYVLDSSSYEPFSKNVLKQ